MAAAGCFNKVDDMFRRIEETTERSAHMQCVDGSRNMSIVEQCVCECHARGDIGLQIDNSAGIGRGQSCRGGHGRMKGRSGGRGGND